MNKIRIFSRKRLEKELQRGFLENVVVISFYDPNKEGTRAGYKPLDLRFRVEAFFMVGVHDLDPSALKDFGYTMDTYFKEAPRLAEFIYKARARGYDIICQCEYGQSRSAGCAAAILEHFSKNGIRVFASYSYYPNQLIFNKLLKALNMYKKSLS